MQTKTITARKQATSTVMSLTGFVTPGEQYIVREVNMNGHKAILIYEPVEKVCAICDEEFIGDEMGDICERCDDYISTIPGGI